MNDKLPIKYKVEISDDVVSRNLQGEVVLLNLKTGSYYSLDSTGTKMWELIQEYKSFEKVLELLLKEYDISEAQCREDLLNFISTLEEKELIKGLIEV